MKDFVKATLNSIAQILFMDLPVLGGLFLISIAVYSPFQAINCVFGGITAILFSIFMKKDHEKIQLGLYGYNAALLGLALPVFLKNGLLSGIFTVVGAVLTIFLYDWIAKRGTYPLTIPFVLITWFCLALSGNIPIQAGEFQETPLSNITFLGIGQVFFVESSLVGVIILILVSWFGKRYAMTIWLGSFAGLLPILYLKDIFPVSAGLVSLNALLSAIALVKLKSEIKIIWVALITLITAVIYPIAYAACTFIGLPALTFPFNVVVLLGLALHSFLLKRKNMSSFTG